MKNIFRFLMAVAVLFTASCAKEDISSSIGGGEVEVTFTANLPELGTRAYGDADHITTLHYFVYDQNGTLLDFDGEGNSTTPISATVPAKVNLPLIKGMTYKLAFWADKNAYNINGDVVTVEYGNANDDTIDAFYALIEEFDPAKAEDQHKTSVTLNRPFAQLNALTDDFAAVALSGVDIETSTVKVVAYTQFNVANGDVVEASKTTIGFTPYAIPTETLAGKADYKYLSMNYILVPKAGHVSNVEFTFTGSKNVTIKDTKYDNVPFKQNYRTNIIGKLLTASTDFEVTIDPVFDTPDKDIVQTAAELQQQIASAQDGEPTEIVLGSDINLNDLFASLGTMSTRAEEAPLPIVIQETKKIILDLNGCRIDAPVVEGNNSKHYYAFENHGTLTIKDTKGNGVINARGNFNYGTMTLESGTINAIDGDGGYGVRNYEDAAFIMNGGKIATTNEDDNQVDKGGYDATPLRVDEGATATINGGVVNNICDFTFAVDNYGDTTVKAGTFTSVHSTVSTYGVMTIDGGTFTCNGLEGITAHALVAWDGSETTINGGTFNGKDNYNGFNVDADEGATVYIKGGLFMPVHSGSLYGDGNIVVSGGKFFDKIKDSRLADGCTLVQEQEGDYWTINFTPAAKIGETTYNTLQDAIEAVQDGETIVLQRDLNITTPAYGQNALNYNKAVNCTIDLNGKTIYANTGNSVLRFNITDSGATSDVELTIKNGTITAGDNTWCALMATGIEGAKAVMNLSTVVVNNSKAGDFGVKSWANALINANNVTVNSTNCAGGFYAVGGEIVLDNCTVNQKGLHTSPYMSMAIAVSTKGQLTVNSGTYTTEPTAAAEGYNQGTSHGSWCGGVMNSGGELIINGGTFANGNYGEDNLAAHARGLIFGDTASEITINNGTFNALKNIIDYQNNLGVQPNPNIVINGGDFSANPSVVTSYGGVIIAEGKAPAQGANGRWTLVDAVSTAEDLVAALAQGGVVTLGANITVSEPVVVSSGVTATIDLNGKTVTAVEYAFENSGNLSIEGDGVVNGIVYNANGGEIAINGGTYNVVDGGKWVLLNDGGKLTINAATINGGSSYPIYSYGANANLVINDATVNATFGCINSYGTGNKVEINGGTYQMTGVQGKTSHIAYFSNVDATINGGTFKKIGDINMSAAGGGGICVIYGANLTIEGGNFAGDYADVYDWGGTNANGRANSTSIKGGTYKFKPTQWIAEGKTATQNADGTWTVK